MVLKFNHNLAPSTYTLYQLCFE